MHRFISDIDTARFRFPIAKIPYPCSNIETVLQELRTFSVKLIISRVNLDDLVYLNKLETLGFQIKDIQLTWNYNINILNEPPLEVFKEYSICSFKATHLTKMIEITKESFNNYGHYFSDDILDKSKCLEIYLDWIIRCCRDKSLADNILVAEKDGIAIGYLALKQNEDLEGSYVSGVIGAVASKYRNIGVFRSINLQSIYWAKSIGANRIENNVLATNFPVSKSYSRMNFSIIRSEATLHYWYE